jgi:hypothetical protein
MKREISVVVVSIFLCTVALADTKPADGVRAEDVIRLQVEHAESDARSAIARGDRRLLAVYGYTTEVPGVNAGVTELRARYGLRMLEGTSDSYKGSKDKALNENARKYASLYNRVVISESSK